MRCLKTVRNDSGYALVAVLLILTALTGLVVVAQANSRLEQRIGANASVNTRAYYTAEAGAENLMAAVREKMDEGLITMTAITEIDPDPPDIEGFTFVEYEADLSSTLTTRTVTQGPWAGLVSLDRDLVLVSSVEGPADSRAAITLMARVQTMPVFQWGIFYQADLEIDPRPRMDIRGRIHTNGELFIRADDGLYMWDMVTAAGDLHIQHKHTEFSYGSTDNYIRLNDGSWKEITRDTHNYGGDDNPATFPSAAQDQAFDDYSAATWDHMIQTRASGIDSLNIPVPGGIDPHSLIEPCTGTESAELQPMKYACNADLVIRVRAGTLEVVDAAGNAVTLADPGAATFRVNKLYDDREQSSTNGDAGQAWGTGVDDASEWGPLCSGTAATNYNSNRDVILLKLGKLLKAEYGDGVIYVTADSVGPGGTVPGCMQQYVLKVQGGNRLKKPLSIATNLPLYVKGDYNNKADKWRPASLVSDAITLLSNAWVDSQSGEGNTENTPINTAVQAAFLAGHSPTPFYGSPQAGGQLENFPRFLEDWTGKTMTIIGSFVSLWYPENANAGWACCWYYDPPQRDWSFDERFRDPALMPPLTPLVGQIMRVGFVRRY